VHIDQPATDLDLVAGHDALAEMGRFAVDTDAAGGNPLLDFPTRTEAGIRQGLL